MYNLTISSDFEGTLATPVTPAAAEAVKKILTAATKDLFGRARAGIADLAGTGSFLAGPQPSNPILAYQYRVGRAACDRWSRGDRNEMLPGNDLVMRSSCADYLAGNMPADPTTGPPFSGGQCPGVRYLFRFNGTIPDPPTNVTTQTVLRGPLSLDTSLQPGDTCGAAGGTFRRWQLVGSNGTVGLWSGCNANLVVLEVRALDPEPGGGCGNPGDEFSAGNPAPTPDPNPGPIPGIPGFPFPGVDVTISPEGDIVIDFGDGEDPEVVRPGDEDEPIGGPDVAPTTPGDPGEADESGDGGSSEGCAPEGQELTGVLVTVLSAHENANKLDRTTETVYRGVGYVAMGYPGLLGVDTSAAVVESPQFFHAQQRGLTCWRVRANVGFNLESTPYYREIEP